MSKDNSLDVLPSRSAILIVRVLGAIALMFLGAMSYFTVFIQTDKFGAIFFGSLFLILFFVMARIVFGTLRKPSRKAKLVFSACFVIISFISSVLVWFYNQHGSGAYFVYGGFFTSLSWFIMSLKANENS